MLNTVQTVLWVDVNQYFGSMIRSQMYINAIYSDVGMKKKKKDWNSHWNDIWGMPKPNSILWSFVWAWFDQLQVPVFSAVADDFCTHMDEANWWLIKAHG